MLLILFSKLALIKCLTIKPHLHTKLKSVFYSYVGERLLGYLAIRKAADLKNGWETLFYRLFDAIAGKSCGKEESLANEGAKNSLLGGGRPFSKVRRVV
ncbi:hypothetical protein QLX08_004115 [Tetragonisca angustula]|uniref:Uncharacterized protein n=1 Tax=Tetragonisca angustula TaxID=166442 RepID=A0AAW1A6T2_9HYME